MAKQQHPQILTANDLIEGDVIFLGPAGWIRDHRLARIARSPEDASALEAFGQAELVLNRIVDPYLNDVSLSENGVISPVHYRERLRTAGPSVRTDLGKQALHGSTET
jgi:hypothetical protein